MPAAELSRLLLALHEAATDAPMEQCKETLLGCLRTAIPFDGAIWGSGAESPQLIFGIAAVDFPLEQLVAYAQWQPHDRLRAALAAQPGVALRQEDLGPIALHHASDMYLGFCRQAGIEHTLGIAEVAPSTNVGELIFLFRANLDTPFADETRDLLEQCLPHLIGARRMRLVAEFARASGTRQTSAALLDRGHAIVDDDGHVHASDPQFGAAMQRAFQGWMGPRLPPMLVDHVRNGSTHFKAGGQQFDLRRGPERHLLRLPDPAATPISAAEMKVAGLFAAGHTASQVADRLCLSPRTVRNHLSAIYAKLGLHSKAELARHMQRRDG